MQDDAEKAKEKCKIAKCQMMLKKKNKKIKIPNNA